MMTDIQTIRLSVEMTGEPKEALELFNVGGPNDPKHDEARDAYKNYIEVRNKVAELENKKDNLTKLASYYRSKGKINDLRETDKKIRECERQLSTLHKEVAKKVHLTGNEQENGRRSLVRTYEQNVKEGMVGSTGLFDVGIRDNDRFIDWLRDGSIKLKEVGTAPSIDVETIRLYKQVISNTGVDHSKIKAVVDKRNELEKGDKDI